MYPFLWLSSNASSILLLILVSCVILILRSRSRAPPCPLPPGPPADPIIGHLRRLPASDRWPEVFGSWSKTYGDVMCLDVLGNKMVILDSVEACNDLLDKRRPKYSDRPRCTMLNLIGVDRITVLLQYGKELALHRKLFSAYFGVKECRGLMPLQQKAAQELVRALLASTGDYNDIFYNATGKLILQATYGHDLQGKDDPILKRVQALTGFSADTSLAMSSLDIFPWLIYLPRWFPGNYWSRFAHDNRNLADETFNIPFESVQRQMRAGTAKSSFVSEHLTHLDVESESAEAVLDAVKVLATMTYAAGMETTASSLVVFVLAMVLFPDVQKTAQADIDRVVGHGRLPTFEDRLDLPCIDRIIHEVGRWAPIVPLGVAHTCSEDDIYRGMFIPKGTIIMPNLTSMAANREVYEDSETFDPDRYLPTGEGGVGEPVLPTFGFGARICPGRFMADNSMWITIATILATCSLQKAKDDQGNAVVPKVEWTLGTVRNLKPFTYSVVPRSNMAAALIDQSQLQ